MEDKASPLSSSDPVHKTARQNGELIAHQSGRTPRKPIVLLVDRRLGSDTFWLQSGLEQLGFGVTIKDIPGYSMRNYEARWRKPILWAQYLVLGWHGARMARRLDGVIVAWSFISGIFAAIFSSPFKNGRPPIVALNMIAFEKGGLHHLLRRLVYHGAIATGRMWVTVNSSPLCDQYVKSFGIPADRISILHDAWGPSHTILPPDRADEGYVFSGGDTARDWDTVLSVARVCSDVPFRVVARRVNWHPTGDIPPNVHIYFDTSPGEFFSIAGGARLAILPLNSNVTAGLIVLIRTVLLGRPVIATRTPGTTPYFPDECTDLLVPMGGAEEMASVLRRYWTDHNLRVKRAMALQSYVLEHFSPDTYAGQVADIVDRACTALEK